MTNGDDQRFNCGYLTPRSGTIYKNILFVMEYIPLLAMGIYNP